jgi:hypothetical protein
MCPARELRRHSIVSQDEQAVVTSMNAHVETFQGRTYVASSTPHVMMRNPGDMLDLLSFGGEHDTNLFLLNETNLDPSFYDLKSGLAGEIVQKMSNNHVRLVIVGSFGSIRSTRFREFLNEANKGTQLRFAEDNDAALSWLLRYQDR